MSKLKDVINKLNGKKRVIAGSAAGVISAPFLIFFLMNMNSTVAETKTQVKTNTHHIEQLDRLPAQMAAVETNVENIKEDIGKIEQAQAVIESDIKKILQAVVR